MYLQIEMYTHININIHYTLIHTYIHTYIHVYIHGSVHEVRDKNVTFVENRKHENAWIVVGVSSLKGAFYRNLIRIHVFKGKRVSAQACQKLVICQCV